MILRLITLLATQSLLAHFAYTQENWQPPDPAASSLVWIKLPSGEWLAGHVQSMRDKDIVFDSEELDERTFDWDDIIELRSASPLTMDFGALGTVTGTVAMKDSIIAVRTGDEMREFPRRMLLSLIEGEPTEWNYWSFNGSVGMVARSGNTDQSDLNTFAFIRRETSRLRIDLDYTGNFGSTGGEQNVNNQNGGVKADWLITQGFFVTPLNLNFLSDRFQNIELRSTIGAGVGYFIKRGGGVEWSVSFGAGHQTTKYQSVLAGEDLTQGTGIIIPGTALDLDLTGALELNADYYSQIGLAEPRNTFHHTSIITTLDVLGDILDFTLSFTWDHNTNPQPADDGTVPKKNDFRTAFGIGIDI